MGGAVNGGPEGPLLDGTPLQALAPPEEAEEEELPSEFSNADSRTSGEDLSEVLGSRAWVS